MLIKNSFFELFFDDEVIISNNPCKSACPAHRPGSFGRIRSLSDFDGLDITKINLKPHNRPIF